MSPAELEALDLLGRKEKALDGIIGWLKGRELWDACNADLQITSLVATTKEKLQMAKVRAYAALNLHRAFQPFVGKEITADLLDEFREKTTAMLKGFFPKDDAFKPEIVVFQDQNNPLVIRIDPVNSYSQYLLGDGDVRVFTEAMKK